jgi:predicted Zn finger-like uncharacterized protein
MLFTRCPDCDTTFRVTDDALMKAHGQVRCGRCASVFNAYAERRDAPAEAALAPQADTGTVSTAPHGPATAGTSAAAAPPGAAPPATVPPASTSAGYGAPPPSVRIAHPVHPAHDAPTQSAQPPRRDVGGSEIPRGAAGATSDETFGTMSVADVVAQVEIGVADEDADTGKLEPQTPDAGISASEVQQVLEGETPAASYGLLGDAPASRPRARLWTAGAALALVALAAQSVHHYRTELVTNAALGPLVQSTYAMLGDPVAPRWDIRQYEILDWIATAEPSTGSRGSLRITARIKNRGPQYQPYPSVQLRLKDRWEEAVGSRVFAPAEYLAAAPRKLMAPGETTRAELEVVDPGQDAYGFELDVCIEVETHVLSCGSDKVFL